MRASYVNDVKSLLSKTDRIRNMSVIAHVDHGKTTLVDSLLAAAGILRMEDAGSRRLLDTGEAQERNITIKSTGISLVFSGESEDQSHLVNLIDSPGHVDFSSEVTAALRISDGAMVVVDCVSGVSVQTETVTRQALGEKLKLVLHINKMDRAIQELSLDAESLYHKLNATVERMNAVVAAHSFGQRGVDENAPSEEDLAQEYDSSLEFHPILGNVSFGSGRQGWAFRLEDFARLIGERTGRDWRRVLTRLWGDHFYDPVTRKFTTSAVSESGETLPRYVCQMVLQPIINVFQKLEQGNINELQKLATQLKIKLRNEEWDLPIKELSNRILQRWMPAGVAVSKMIIDKLPSPLEAQRYRVGHLYTGPLDDPTATAIRTCDATGPLSVFISKMVPTEDGSRCYAFGRVFSGTIKAGQEVRILATEGKTEREGSRRIPRIVLMMGAHVEGVDEIPAGCTVGVVGVDSLLLKTGTICSLPTARPIAPMTYTVSPVVRRAVAPTNPALLPKFIIALRRLHKSEQGLDVIINESTNEYIVAGSGELHVEVALNSLRELLGPDFTLTVGEPIVEFRETVTAPSAFVCLGKSTNKHNRIFITAEPLPAAALELLASSELSTDLKKRTHQLVAAGLSPDDVKKLWLIQGTNILVDRSKGVPYLSEARDSITNAFSQLCEQSPLTNEPLSGVLISLMDAKVHADPSHRGAGQVSPAALSAMRAAVLCAQPRLVEPMFTAEIQAETHVISKVHQQLAKRRGRVISEERDLGGGTMCTLSAELPVYDSIGFPTDLRTATGGRAFLQLTFSHWQVMTTSAYDTGSRGHGIAMQVRARKGLRSVIPVADDFNERL